MKKNIIQRGLFGIPVGITIGLVITLGISIAIGDGTFYPVTPQLIDVMGGNQLYAVILQTVLCGVMGAGFSIASIIWEIDSWSLTKQSAVYFVVACVIMFPISYAANWMHHSVMGVISYIAMFIGIFIIVWPMQYCAWKIQLKKINKKVQQDNNIK